MVNVSYSNGPARGGGHDALNLSQSLGSAFADVQGADFSVASTREGFAFGIARDLVYSLQEKLGLSRAKADAGFQCRYDLRGDEARAYVHTKEGFRLDKTLRELLFPPQDRYVSVMPAGITELNNQQLQAAEMLKNNPSIAQAIVVSPSGLFGSDRSYIMIFERDPADPHTMIMRSMEFQGTDEALGRFVSNLTGHSATSLTSETGFDLIALNDDRHITGQSFITTLEETFGSSVDQNYLSRVKDYFAEEATRVSEINRRIDQKAQEILNALEGVRSAEEALKKIVPYLNMQGGSGEFAAIKITESAVRDLEKFTHSTLASTSISSSVVESFRSPVTSPLPSVESSPVSTPAWRNVDSGVNRVEQRNDSMLQPLVVAENSSRAVRVERVEENLRFVRNDTGSTFIQPILQPQTPGLVRDQGTFPLLPTVGADPSKGIAGDYATFVRLQKSTDGMLETRAVIEKRTGAERAGLRESGDPKEKRTRVFTMKSFVHRWRNGVKSRSSFRVGIGRLRTRVTQRLKRGDGQAVAFRKRIPGGLRERLRLNQLLPKIGGKDRNHSFSSPLLLRPQLMAQRLIRVLSTEVMTRLVQRLSRLLHMQRSGREGFTERGNFSSQKLGRTLTQLPPLGIMRRANLLLKRLDGLNAPIERQRLLRALRWLMNRNAAQNSWVRTSTPRLRALLLLRERQRFELRRGVAPLHAQRLLQILRALSRLQSVNRMRGVVLSIADRRTLQAKFLVLARAFRTHTMRERLLLAGISSKRYERLIKLLERFSKKPPMMSAELLFLLEDILDEFLVRKSKRSRNQSENEPGEDAKATIHNQRKSEFFDDDSTHPEENSAEDDRVEVAPETIEVEEREDQSDGMEPHLRANKQVRDTFQSPSRHLEIVQVEEVTDNHGDKRLQAA